MRTNARVERMIRELKADSPRTLLDWLLGPEPKVEQPEPAAETVQPAAVKRAA